jgi:hypothetical protein
VIEKTGLPKGSPLFVWEYFQYRAFQSLDPSSENKVLITANEEMQMIRHDHIATNRSAEIALGSLGEENECGMNFFASQT